MNSTLPGSRGDGAKRSRGPRDWAKPASARPFHTPRFLESSPERIEVEANEQQLEELWAGRERLQLEAAPIERLVRAFENVELAGRLRAKGGAAWAAFERLRRCEASLP